MRSVESISIPPSAPSVPRSAGWTLFSTSRHSTPSSSFSIRIASARYFGSRYFCQVSRGSSTWPSASTVRKVRLAVMSGSSLQVSNDFRRDAEVLLIVGVAQALLLQVEPRVGERVLVRAVAVLGPRVEVGADAVGQ